MLGRRKQRPVNPERREIADYLRSHGWVIKAGSWKSPNDGMYYNGLEYALDSERKFQRDLRWVRAATRLEQAGLR